MNDKTLITLTIIGSLVLLIFLPMEINTEESYIKKETKITYYDSSKIEILEDIIEQYDKALMNYSCVLAAKIDYEKSQRLEQWRRQKEKLEISQMYQGEDK